MKDAKTSITPVAATLTLVGVTASITLSESVFRVLYDTILSELPYPGLYLLYFAPGLTALLVSVPLALPHRYVGPRIIVVLASLTIAVFVVRFFRGSHLWPGFFDLPEHSPISFYAALVVGTAIGYWLHRRLSMRSTRAAVATITVLAVLWTWLDAFRGIRVVSEFPYSRHVALLAMTLLLPLAWGSQRVGVLLED